MVASSASAARAGGAALLLVCLALTGGCAGDGSLPGSEVAPAAGEVAPDFGLPDQDRRQVRLQDLRGRWVVLYFYPSDDTPGCTLEATEFTELLESFEQVNAVVLGVSGDPPLSHRYFREKRDLGIRLLSDVGREVMAAYGAWCRSTWRRRTVGRTIRSTFLIDPDGRVAWRWRHVVPEGHAAQVRAKLLELAGG
ncbi:MAG: peroxiredoxin [Planctomycetota bacterium]